MRLPFEEQLANLGFIVEPCGSRITCDPPPMDTDEDFLVYLFMSDAPGKAMSTLMDILETNGYEWEGDTEHYQSVADNGFMSWRNAEGVNLIVTKSADFAQRHMAATSVCKRLNLMDKADRIAVFQAVLYGNISK